VSCNSMVSGVYIYTVKSDFHVSCYSVESESLIVGSNRISICRITVLRLEYLFIRSNRISMCRVTVWSLESLLVRSARRIGLFFIFCRYRCYPRKGRVTVYKIKFVVIIVPSRDVLLVLSEWCCQRHIMTEDQYACAPIRELCHIAAGKSVGDETFSLPIEICVCHCVIYMLSFIK